MTESQNVCQLVLDFLCPLVAKNQWKRLSRSVTTNCIWVIIGIYRELCTHSTNRRRNQSFKLNFYKRINHCLSLLFFCSNKAAGTNNVNISWTFSQRRTPTTDPLGMGLHRNSSFMLLSSTPFRRHMWSPSYLKKCFNNILTTAQLHGKACKCSCTSANKVFKMWSNSV